MVHGVCSRVELSQGVDGELTWPSSVFFRYTSCNVLHAASTRAAHSSSVRFFFGTILLTSLHTPACLYLVTSVVCRVSRHVTLGVSHGISGAQGVCGSESGCARSSSKFSKVSAIASRC